MAFQEASPKASAQFSPNRDLVRPQNSLFSAQNRVANSRTWSYATGELEKLDVIDDIDDRSIFFDEYNRIAENHSIRPFVPDHHDKLISEGQDGSSRQASWFTRAFKRQLSAQSSEQTSDPTVRSKYSIGDTAMHIVHPIKDDFKHQDLQELVRLCGKNFLYLPSDFAPCPLILPTSLRATAHYLVQHAIATPGTFRIPGSLRVVNEIYDYYCTERQGDEIMGTVRAPNLPSHIDFSVHDVASIFKKFLSLLPGGILGSLNLFDALVEVERRLGGKPGPAHRRQDVVRARLIALAVGTVQSQFRRELICAVFGLLCLLGQEGQKKSVGKGLATSEMMGYNAFGIVFGPLLLGDLLDSYTLKLTDPSSGQVLASTTPSKLKKHRKKSSGEDYLSPNVLALNKIRVANDITEMLITNWLEVVRNMKSLNILRSDSWISHSSEEKASGSLKTSDSDPFVRRRPRNSGSGILSQELPTRLPPRGQTSIRTKENAPPIDRSGIGDTAPGLSVTRTRPEPSTQITTRAPTIQPTVSLLASMAKEPSRNPSISPQEHRTSLPREAIKNRSSSSRPSHIHVSSQAKVQHISEMTTVDRPIQSPINPGDGGRGNVRPARDLVTGAKILTPKRLAPNSARDRKASDVSRSTGQSPQNDVEAMSWLGDYLVLEEGDRAMFRAGHKDVPVASPLLATPSRDELPRADLAASRSPASKEQRFIGETISGLTIRNIGSHELPPFSGIQKFDTDFEVSRRNLGHKRSKTISTTPVTPQRSHHCAHHDRRQVRKSFGGVVKSMAAMFDNAAKESSSAPSPAGKARPRRSSKVFNGLSLYTMNPSPAKSHSFDTLDQAHITPDKLKIMSAPQNRGAVANQQQDTPTRRPLRSLTGDNTNTLDTPQDSPKFASNLPQDGPDIPRAGPLWPIDRIQIRHVEDSTSGSPELTTPKLEMEDLHSTAPKGKAIPQRRRRATHTRFEALQRTVDAKEEENKELKETIAVRDETLASLTHQLEMAKIERNAWQRRAEAAEKRVGVFVSRAIKIKEISRASSDKDMSLGAGLSLRSTPQRAERSSSSTYSRDGDVLNRKSNTSSSPLGVKGFDSPQLETSSEWSGGTRPTPDYQQTLVMAVDELLQMATGPTEDLEYMYAGWP